MRKMHQLMPSMLLSSFVIAFFLFMIAPIVIVVVIAFTPLNYISFPIPGISLRWFYRVIEYAPFYDAFVVSVKVALGSALFGTILGVPAALCLSRSRSWWANAIATFMISPLSMPLIVLGFSLLFYLAALGLPLSLTSLLIAHTVVAIPYLVRTVIGVYRSTPRSHEEAAQMLGATPLKVFWHITLPTIRPAIFAGCLFSILISIDNLPLSYFFGSTTTNTLPVVVLSYLEFQFDPAVPAINVLQLVLAIIVLILMDRTYGLRRLTVSM